jgi:multiple sugar transport system permease protein
MYEAYKSGFVYGDMGRALALVMVLLVLVIATVAMQFRLFSQEEAN